MRADRLAEEAVDAQFGELVPDALPEGKGEGCLHGVALEVVDVDVAGGVSTLLYVFLKSRESNDDRRGQLMMISLPCMDERRGRELTNPLERPYTADRQTPRSSCSAHPSAG